MIVSYPYGFAKIIYFFIPFPMIHVTPNEGLEKNPFDILAAPLN